MSSTYKVISLGQLSVDLDPTEETSGSRAENADALVGTTFDDLTKDSVVTWSPNQTNSYAATPDQLGRYDTYNQNANYGWDAFDITDADGNVTSHFFDSVVEYTATVTYADGTSQTGTILIAQAYDGQAYVMPPSSFTPTAILNGSIQSITIDSVPTNGANGSGLYYDRSDLPDLETVPCFARGTQILTERGTRAIEELSRGDLVMTRDHGLQPIRWIGARKIDAADLSQAANLRPVRIRRDALGRGLPDADLLVSPQHRILVRSEIARKMFGATEILVAAKQLCQLDGIDIAQDVQDVEYFHMLFEQHEVIISNGAETESLYTGPEALKSVGPAAREEIFALFPQLRQSGHIPVAARPLATGRMGRKLALRHHQNSKMLVS